MHFNSFYLDNRQQFVSIDQDQSDLKIILAFGYPEHSHFALCFVRGGVEDPTFEAKPKGSKKISRPRTNFPIINKNFYSIFH